MSYQPQTCTVESKRVKPAELKWEMMIEPRRAGKKRLADYARTETEFIERVGRPPFMHVSIVNDCQALLLLDRLLHFYNENSAFSLAGLSRKPRLIGRDVPLGKS